MPAASRYILSWALPLRRKTPEMDWYDWNDIAIIVPVVVVGVVTLIIWHRNRVRDQRKDD